MRRVRIVLRVVCVLCLLGVGFVLGQAALVGARTAPLPVTASPVAATPVPEGGEAAGGGHPVRESGESEAGVPGSAGPDVPQHGVVPQCGGDGEPSRLGLALATVGNRLVEIWRQVMEEGLADPDIGGGEGVLSDVELWGGAARLRTTYEMVDLDRLQERMAGRLQQTGERLVGLSGELNVGEVGSVRIGYRLGLEGEDTGYVRVADAEVEYRLGKRASVAADVIWGVGTDFDHSAGLDVTYEIAPNTSLQARYRLLDFGDGQRGVEQHSAEARLQLRF